MRAARFSVRSTSYVMKQSPIQAKKQISSVLTARLSVVLYPLLLFSSVSQASVLEGFLS